MEMVVTFPGGMKVDAHYKGHRIRTDQPGGEGGENTAPSPFDLFIASIGTCTGFYVMVFCRERNLSTDDITVVLNSERNREKKLITKMTVEIRLPADFPRKYEKAVIAAANQCTVKRHLQDVPEITLSSRIG
jgi:ribosomal protein S12 methylthiotransferase accessory factor